MPSCLRLRCSGLSILEALTLLSICVILLLIAVPVTLVRMGVLKPVEQVGSTPPKKTRLHEKTRALTPLPNLITPKFPTLPDSPKSSPFSATDSSPKAEPPKATSPVVPNAAPGPNSNPTAPATAEPEKAPAPAISPTIAPPPFKPIPLTEEVKR